jgi:hypothetical protein
VAGEEPYPPSRVLRVLEEGIGGGGWGDLGGRHGKNGNGGGEEGEDQEKGEGSPEELINGRGGCGGGPPLKEVASARGLGIKGLGSGGRLRGAVWLYHGGSSCRGAF